MHRSKNTCIEAKIHNIEEKVVVKRAHIYLRVRKGTLASCRCVERAALRENICALRAKLEMSNNIVPDLGV